MTAPAGGAALLSVRGLTKRFGTTTVLAAVDLELAAGEAVAVCGPSGSGKSTLLRCIAGLERADAGTVRIDGIATQSGGRVTARAPVGMVFQAYNLFPHMTVRQNLLLGLRKVRRLDAARAEVEAGAMLDRVGLGDKLESFPAALSGGQQQRVAIARALCMRPALMLFDEPTSALDPETTGEVLDAIRDLARSGMAMVVVTHELGFAAGLARRIVFMDAGAVVEDAAPDDFLSAPRTDRARQFLAARLS